VKTSFSLQTAFGLVSFSALVRILAGIVPVLLVSGLVGCNNDTTSPSRPTTTSPPLQAGSIQMRGTVSDTAYRSLAGARVEVLDGPQAGLSTTADGRGEFSMTAVFDETTRFRATAEGHVEAIRTLQPFCERCNPNWWINFALEVPDSPVEIGGDYTLTFVANDTCTMLPADLRSRTYTATIPMTSSALPAHAIVGVGGANVLEGWNAIGLGVAGDYVALWLETLVDQIAPNTFLSFSGEAAAVVGASRPSTFVLPFNGSIAHCVTTAEKGEYGDCYGGPATTRSCNSRHQLIFNRR